MKQLQHVHASKLPSQFLDDIAEARASVSPRDYGQIDLLLQHIKYLTSYKEELENLEHDLMLGEEITSETIAEALARASRN